MLDDKKRKPSRDFPAHAQVPLGKAQAGANGRARVALPPVPPMHDPYHILNAPDDADALFPASLTAARSMPSMSVESMASMLSVDDAFQMHSAAEQDEELFDTGSSTSSLPKNERPAQPASEREYFEKLWAENFERSEARINQTSSSYLPVGAAGRLNRIKGFSFARDAFSHKLYAVFRMEIECIVSEKQWTIYRRFHDFKQLAHQLKNESMRIPTVPTRTLMRSLDPNFLRKRQLELDRWLREVLMLISLENCKVDTEKYAECCGSRGVHASCRIIRYFLTHKANEPPTFVNVDTTSISATASAGGRPTLYSISETKIMPAAEESSSVGTTPTTQRQIDMLSSSLDRSDMMGSSAAGESTSAFAPGSQRRSVILQDVEDEEDEDGDSTMSTSSNGRNGGKKVSLKQFDVLRMIGKGSFGKVLLVRKKNTGQLFAVKILSKPIIVKKQQVEHTRTERRVLASISHPFVVCLHYAFQTKDKLYFVLDYCPGGDLFFHLSRCGCFPEPMVKFYAAEIVLALIHLHEQGIVYRDLKPENIMLDVDGHVKLADFGLAKEGITSELNGTYTMCGTPEYLPPEILNRAGHGTAVDWWNLGMVIYEMLTGRPPWYTQDRQELFTRLREAELEFPEGLSPEAMDLIQGLLTRDPAKRLGAIDAREITYHPFFGEIDWNMLYQREVEPLYRPCQYTDPIDAANFEEEFTKLPLAQIDSAGMSVPVSELERQANEAAVAANGGATAMSISSVAGGAAGASSGDSSARNSNLRNLSYTFAGFTYDGTSQSIARSNSFDGSLPSAQTTSTAL